MLLPENIDSVRQAILFDLFGSGIKSIDDVTSVDMVKLLRVELKEQLTNKKLKSLSKKYFSIPPEVLSYYLRVCLILRKMRTWQPRDLGAGERT
jgi:hypothetical protein